MQPTSKHRQNRDRPSTKVARAPGRSFSSSSYNSQQVTKTELMNNIIQDYSSDEGCEAGDRQGQLFGRSEPVPSGPKRRMSWVDPENDRDSPPPRKYRSEQRDGYRVDRREDDERLDDREDSERQDDRGHRDGRDEHSERSSRRDQRDRHDFREPRNRGDYCNEQSDRGRRTERRSEPHSESCRTEHRRADLTERERRSENRAARRTERDQRATQRREPEPNDSDVNHVDSDERDESLSPVGNALIADKDPAPVNLLAMGLENSGRQQKRDLFSGKSTGGGSSGGASSGIVKEMPLDTTTTSVGGSLEFGESGLLGHESFLTAYTTHSKLMEFVQAPVPNDKLVLCKLTRSKTSSGSAGVFKLTLDAPDSDQKTMIVARREFKGNGYHTYFYCENEYLGKTKGSNGSTKFTLYDNGLSKKKAKSRRHRSKGLVKQKQLGSVTYVYRKKGPRQLIAQLPEAVRDGGSKDVFLVNMLPAWDKSAKRYTMKFFGRAAVSSVKNFKLVEDNLREGEERPHKLLFGKVEDDVFSLDFRAPFTPLQAMAYALTTFEKSLKESLKR